VKPIIVDLKKTFVGHFRLNARHQIDPIPFIDLHTCPDERLALNCVKMHPLLILSPSKLALDKKFHNTLPM
jgi:hypothetical protein